MSVATYFNAEFNPTTADDPKRLIWYGPCRYWTDDWSKVALRGESGIPCCPKCGAPGFQTDAADWDQAVRTHEADRHPGYAAAIAAGREVCTRARITEFMSLGHGLGDVGDPCPYCSAAGALVKTCGTCKGTGKVVVSAEARVQPK